MFYSISEFFPEYYYNNNLNLALAEWNRLNYDIPYEVGIAYLAPYWEILKQSDSTTWNQKTIPMTIYTDYQEFNDEGAVNWDYNTLYLRVIDEKFGDEARDWFFETEEEVLPIPAREDTNKIILEWLIEKNILKKEGVQND